MSERTGREVEWHERHNAHQRAYFEGTDKRTMVPSGSPYVRRQVDELLRAARIPAGARVLEVGAGRGRYSYELLRHGLRLEAMDLSPVLLDQLRAGLDDPGAIALHCFDVKDPPPELVGRFDAIVGFFTLHHLHDLTACFRGMAATLKPGASLTFLEPNPLNPLYYLQIALTPGMTWEGDGGIVRMRRGLLSAALTGSGFGQVTFERFGFLPPAIVNRTSGRALERTLERVPPLGPLRAFQLVRAERR